MNRGLVRGPLLVALLVGAGMVALPRPERAAAHPLGNFTINRYARLEPGADAIRVAYALDLAEIPTVQEMLSLDRDRDRTMSAAEEAAYLGKRLPELARNLRLTVNGARLALRPAEGGRLTLAEGQGGLPVLRLDAVFVATLPAGAGGALAAEFRDENYAKNLGWKEIVVRGTEGAALIASDAPAEDLSDGLRAYPPEVRADPPDRRAARFRFQPGVAGAAASQPNAIRTAVPAGGAGPKGTLSRFAASAATERLTLPVMLVSLLAAVFWGALHALGPGHGKTVVAAYLVGSRGTAKHALYLGLTVTATHTAGVYLLGVVTLAASRFVVPERLYPALSLLSGLTVVGMGIGLLASRLREARRPRVAAHGHAHAHGGHEHSHGHGHGGHSHGGHSHAIPGMGGAPVTWRSLTALGIYGGMIPCPTAIVVLLTSISLGRVGFGLLLVAAFSAGLAAVLMGIGLVLVYVRRAFARVRVTGTLARAVPVASAAAVLGVGLLITLRATGAPAPPI